MFISGIYRGLCATCSNSVICTFAKESGTAVTACEEFEAYSMSRPIAAGGHFSPAARSWVRPDEERISGEPGLCGTCRSGSGCERESDKPQCPDYR